MWRATLASLRANHARLALTFTTVLLATTFVAGAMVISQSLAEGRGELRGDLAVLVTSAADLGMVDPGQTSQGGATDVVVSEELRARLGALPGVAEAVGVVDAHAAAVGSDGRTVNPLGAEARLSGTNWTDTGRMELTGGRSPASSTEVAVLDRVASAGGLSIGDTITVLHESGSVQATLTGTYTYHPHGRETSGTPAVTFATPTAQRLLLEPDTFTAVELATTAGTTPEEVLDRVQAALPPELTAISRAQLTADLDAQAEQAAAALQTTVLGFTAIALLIGSSLIVNTFSMLIARRGRELALLRAIGATRRQVRRSVLLEAATVGAAGSAAGLLAGIGLAVPAVRFAARIDATLSSDLVLSPAPVLVTIAVGTGVTVLAAWLPARRAAATPPVAALRDDPVEQAAGPPWRRRFGIVLAVSAGTGLLAGQTGDGVPAKRPACSAWSCCWGCWWC